MLAPLCAGADFFPAALSCAEVASILHRTLVEPSRSCGGKDAGDANENEEAIREKYQGEIEHLRALTEKGMSAMESSHKRRIDELEEKHIQELDRLHMEKERALAEETQATLAALDAMRKAHEAEVQREIGRFKEEYLSRKVHRYDKDEKELEDIRTEIMSLSEKYSHKCLESAALEQKVSTLSQQVATYFFSLIQKTF